MTRAFNRTETKSTRRRLRRQMTGTEVLLWQRLRDRQAAGFKFRRQFSVGPYILDFYCPAAHLAVEIDGQSHEHEVAAQHDQERQAYIESFGITFVRFNDFQVRNDLGLVVEIVVAAAESGASLSGQ